MAIKKGTKKRVTKKKSTAAKKRSPAARPKKALARRAKKSSIRKASARRAAPKKSAQKKTRARSPNRTTPARKSIRREDRPGHLDPHYAAELRAQSGPREEEPEAFIEGPRSAVDDLAEERGEEVIEKATTGEDEAEEALDQVVPEERGGPFVETNASQEFAHGTDASNPKGAKREPFPTT